MTTTGSAKQTSTTAAAWVAVVAVPVMFVIGLGGAYVIEGLVAPDLMGDDRSFLADLLGAILIIVLVLVPGMLAWRLGGRALRQGDQRGGVPRVVGPALAAVAVLFVVVQMIVNAASGSY
ncbi:hypothetical protein ACNHYB_03340 [Isoptericola jiangsuensis]|uniref:hypothetical protein n=1 Tax=Isoptericola jiangsuensis TaxID=548579 RepID=UPI003AAE88ED